MLSETGIEEELAKLFTSLGYSFTKEGVSEGASGYKHLFDFLLQKGNQTIYLDFASDVSSLIASLAKSIDIKGNKIIIAVKKHEALTEFLLVTRKAELLTSQPKIREPIVIMYENADELLNKLRFLLSQL
ncbi:MAG: hypothetical protein QXY49_03350 [Thermofilaceae archaeon]